MKHLILIIILSPLVTVHGSPYNAHRYRPAPWWGESRFTCPWLSSIALQGLHGSAENIRGPEGNRIPLAGSLTVSEWVVDGTQNIGKNFFIRGLLDGQKITFIEPNIEQTAETITEGKLTNRVIMGGWNFTYQKTTEFDFIDGTIDMGYQSPSFHGAAPVTDLLRYDAGDQFFLEFLLSIGALEWITAGFHLGGAHYFCTPIPKRGLIETGLYIKFDHVIKGISFIISYTFDKQFPHRYTPSTVSDIASTLVPIDLLKRGWTMHTIDLWWEWDPITTATEWCPRLSIVWRKAVRGHNIFCTHLAGGSVVLDVRWDL